MTTELQELTVRECVDALDTAWTIIANAGGGEWERNEAPEWVVAAKRWRDEMFHPILGRWVVSEAGRVAEEHVIRGDDDADSPVV